MKKDVLLLRCDRAGDAIKSLPAIRLAKRKNPEIRFSVLASTHNASLYAFEPGIRVFTLPPHWETLSKETLKRHIEGFAFPDRFDCAINLLCDVFTQSEELLSLLPAHTVYSNHRNLKLSKGSPAKNSEIYNIADLLGQALKCDLLTELNSVELPPTLSIADHEEASIALGKKENVWIALCPFAGPGNRGHQDRRWRNFLKKISQKHPGAHFFLFGAPGDLPRLKMLKAGASPHTKVSIHTPSSFRALGAYLLRMDGVIAVDSGPMHYAQSLGIPSLGLLSGGDVERWFLRNPKDHLVPRGRLMRHPLLFEMDRAFRKWASLSLPRLTPNSNS